MSQHQLSSIAPNSLPPRYSGPLAASSNRHHSTRPRYMSLDSTTPTLAGPSSSHQPDRVANTASKRSNFNILPSYESLPKRVSYELGVAPRPWDTTPRRLWRDCADARDQQSHASAHTRRPSGPSPDLQEGPSRDIRAESRVSGNDFARVSFDPPFLLTTPLIYFRPSIFTNISWDHYKHPNTRRYRHLSQALPETRHYPSTHWSARRLKE